MKAVGKNLTTEVTESGYVFLPLSTQRSQRFLPLYFSACSALSAVKLWFIFENTPCLKERQYE